MHEEFKKFLEPVRPCLICGQDEEGNRREIWARDGMFTARLCRTCDLVTVDPVLTDKGMEIYYRDNIKVRASKKQKIKDRKIQYQLDAAFLHTHINCGKVLDIGCNGGFFLDALDARFEKCGMEIDAEAVRYANENYDFDIRNEWIGNDTFENDAFDLVIFRGVIEHFKDPAAAARCAAKKLKRGGLMYFCATPNLDSFSADLYREKWNQWHPVQHINIFNTRSLHAMLGVDKFRITAKEFPYTGTPYEAREKDYAKIRKDILLIDQGRGNEVETSGPFWGNMMTVLFEKIHA